MGYAARMRGSGEFSRKKKKKITNIPNLPPIDERNVLNKIIHSEDLNQNTRRYGQNPFPATHAWDPKVQDALMEIAKRHRMQDIITGLEISSFTYKIRQIVRLIISTLRQPTTRSASLQRVVDIVEQVEESVATDGGLCGK